MVSKMIFLGLATLLFVTAMSLSEPDEMLTDEEKEMVEETLAYFLTQDWRKVMQELRDRILKLHPQYLDMMTKLHLVGDQDLTLADTMNLVSYFTAVMNGDLCHIQQDLKSKDIVFGVDDMKNIGGVVVAGVKERMPGVTPERAAQWDGLLAKVVDRYQKLQDGEVPCPAE